MMMGKTAPVLAFGLLVASPASAALARDGDDEVEMQKMRTEKPHAAELIEEGELRGAAGSLEQASLIFRAAEAEYPMAGLPWRRHCEALTALGRRGEAVGACSRAVMNRHANVAVRALVRALVAGPVPPSANDLFIALTMTASLREKGLAPTPVAMACSIAESLGDGAMLQHCAEELERVAPGDHDTLRALTLLQSRCPPTRFWMGWGAVVAAIVLTIGHALRTRLRRFLGRRAVAGLVAGLLWALPAIGHADTTSSDEPLSQWHVDDDHPEKDIPSEKARNADPLQFGYWLQDLAFKASRARERGDHAAAVKFYSALAMAVPDEAVAFVELCKDYEAMGDLEKAIQTCGDALLLEGTTVKDYARFVDLLLSKPGPLGRKETVALAQVIQHMRTDPAADTAVDQVECKVGVRTSNVTQLRECTAALAARSPELPATITYQWALALLEGKFRHAEELIQRAQAAGVPVDGMIRATAAKKREHGWHVILVLTGIALLLASGGALAKMLSRRRSTSGAAPVLPPPSADALSP